MPDNSNIQRPFRVLCIDGGGMRGVYTAAYLDELSRRYAIHRGLSETGLDIGMGFNLVVGTSTGAIVSAALATAVPPSRILDLYRQKGSKIFPVKLPTRVNWKLAIQLCTRPRSLKRGNIELFKALKAEFGSITLGELYANRSIGLAITAVEMSRHHAWIFKTPHLPNSISRDNNYRLYDVCLASSAAPLYRSLAAINNPDVTGHRVFADGGLFANTPILVGLIDALQMTATDQKVEIFGLGNCKRPTGDFIEMDDVHWGLSRWKFGGRAAALSLDAQEEVSWHIARLLCPHFDRDVSLIRFPQGVVATELHDYLDLDETSPIAIEALVMQAQADVNETLSLCGDETNPNGKKLKDLLMGIPPLNDVTTET